MTGPTSTPRGERAGRPGTTWEQQLVPMLLEPCDHAEPPPRTVPPLGPWELRGQLTARERANLHDVDLTGEYL